MINMQKSCRKKERKTEGEHQLKTLFKLFYNNLNKLLWAQDPYLDLNIILAQTRKRLCQDMNVILTDNMQKKLLISFP